MKMSRLELVKPNIKCPKYSIGENSHPVNNIIYKSVLRPYHRQNKVRIRIIIYTV